jgi:hypothetical protein
MFDATQANARVSSRSATAALQPRSVVLDDPRFPSLRAVGRHLNRAIRRPVIACLLWRIEGLQRSRLSRQRRRVR